MIKHFLTLLLCVFSLMVWSQETKEQKVETDISEVTVFLEGAQVSRNKTIDIAPGITLLKFTGLSPFINGKSIQVKAGNEVVVLSANHQQNQLDTLERSKTLSELEDKRRDIDDKIRLERTHQEIVAEKIAFLQENRDIGGTNQAVTAGDLRSASEFYGSSLTALKLEALEREKTLRTLNKEKAALEVQIRSIYGKTEFASGEIIVKVKAEKAGRTAITLNYLVSNAGWHPSYDIRATNVNQPVTLAYKANVRQDTKVDWKDVRLKFSSANPNTSGTAPELRTWYLDYNTPPPSYEQNVKEVSGYVRDVNGQPIPGANVVVKGSTIGTQTNFDGYYSIAIPGEGTVLTFSFIGMVSQDIPARQPVINVTLQEDSQALEEVVVTGYGNKRNKDMALEGRAAGVSIRGTVSTIPLETVRNQTTVDFEIDMPYSIASDNQSRTVEMVRYSLPATYRYYAVPKIEKEAFLIARVTDWEQYDLLEGEANIFFENTYVGKSILDVRYATEALELSLGRDKNVSINREKDLDLSGKKFFGSKKEETRRWKISVKNNKSTDINLVVLDQVPLSRLEEIDVEVEELSGGKLDEITGEVQWELELDPSEKKELILEYTVKYPKRNSVIVE
ncbi:DUF4139 domain-containing protein [Robertkochia flava]|uniref:DUF4139 domain-containing protein n=1 Tax=Robertkochia flava TaxID=3447986 RepID=UPI001CCA71E8|nr:DUF4139 domain-containing protein [Robertkochia marina]